MEFILKTYESFASIAINASIILAFVGMMVAFYMTDRATRAVKKGRATKMDALFLSQSSPGLSRFSILNSPDNFGLGLYTALALEQVGAINDIKQYVEASLRVYPDWSTTYFSAARYYALVGDEQKARDYLSIGDTIYQNKKFEYPKIPQIKREAVEALLASNAQPLVNTISVESMFNDIRKKPHLLLVVRSYWIVLVGVITFFIIIVLNIIKSYIT